MVNQTVKYTAVLPQDYKNELRVLTEKKIISSINQGIRSAIENFLIMRSESEYIHNMREASKDESFNKRMKDTMTAFEYADAKVDDEW